MVMQLMYGGGVTKSVPQTVRGLLARYVADDLIGTIADAAKVTSWPDAAGDTDVAHGTAGNQPVFDEVDPQFNGHASVSFERANSHYLFASTGDVIDYFSGADKPFTAFVVARYATKPGSETSEAFLSLGDSAGATPLLQCFTRHTSNALRARFSVNDGGGAIEVSGLNELIDLGPQVHCWGSDGATVKHYLAGASMNPHYDASTTNITSGDYSAAGSMTFNRFAIGALLRSTVANHANCKFAEIIIYNRELSEAERVRVSDYLWNRYCANPYPASSPSRTELAYAHHWDASSIAEIPGDPCSRLTNSVDITNDLVASGSARPTVRLDAATGNEYLEFDGVANVMNPEAATAANWTFLHSGASSYGVWMVVRIPSSAGSAYQPILDTNGNSTTAQGIAVGADATSAAHSLQIKIGNGSTNVINHDSQDYGLRPDVWHVIHWTVEASQPSTEETYQIWIDNENYLGVDASNAADADAAVGSLLVGKLVGASTFGKFDLGEIIITNEKPGRPGASYDINRALAMKWGTQHCALVAGNGLAGVMNDSTPHRGFPAMCQDSTGVYHIIYRQAATHGTSRGVGVHQSSEDGITWSLPRVIYDVDDADGRDFRGGGAFICLTQGEHAGRLLFLTNWSADDSNIEVTGVPSTNLLGISDDNGGSWTWINPQENDPKNVWQDPWEYTVASAASLLELSTGRIVMTFASNDVGLDTNNQDINLSYSDDGGETWSASIIIALHDVCFNNQADKRATESWIVEWPDGELTLYLRNDTDKEIWRAVGDIADLESWTFDTAKLFDGWGRPVFIQDPSTADAGWMFLRSDPGDLSVWRYSTDRGATFDAAKAFSNLHQSTPFNAYTTMSYHHGIVDADGAVWVCYGLERQPDSDIWVRRWSPAT